MADNADIAADLEAARIAQGLAAIVADLPEGEAGECTECFEDMPRLVGGRCGFCRDGRKPPLSFYADRAAAPSPPASTTKEHAPMAHKTPLILNRKIEFTDAAAAAIENRAEGAGISYKQAAAELIEIATSRLADQAGRVANPPMSGGVLSVADVDELLDEVRARFNLAASKRDLEDDLTAAIARAEAAEQKLDAMKALLGQ